MLLVAMSVTIFSRGFLSDDLLLDGMWEQFRANLREELFEAQIKSALQGVIANNAVICG